MKRFTTIPIDRTIVRVDPRRAAELLGFDSAELYLMEHPSGLWIVELLVDIVESKVWCIEETQLGSIPLSWINDDDPRITVADVFQAVKVE